MNIRKIEINKINNESFKRFITKNNLCDATDFTITIDYYRKNTKKIRITAQDFKKKYNVFYTLLTQKIEEHNFYNDLYSISEILEIRSNIFSIDNQYN